MSVTIMARVFWTEIPQLSYNDRGGKRIGVDNKSAKLTLLAIADNADDFGENSWQAFETLAKKTSLERRSVVRVIHALIVNNYCKLNGVSIYGTNDYSINLEKLGNPPKKRTKNGRPAKETSDSGAEISDSGAETSDPESPESPLPILETPIGASAPNLGLEWQLTHSQEVTQHDLDLQKEAEYKNSADLIAMGLGINAVAGYNLALAFMQARKIVIAESKVKGQRKAVRDLLSRHITPQNVTDAVNKLIADGMTVTDLFSVIETADHLANPPEVKQEETPADRMFRKIGI